MNLFPKISIVTPSFNDEKYLEKTICSLLDQNYPNLEYIIVDGGSTDGSVDIIKKYHEHLAFWKSSPDRGMYDAINQGFIYSTGNIMGWINSDDRHQPGSLFTIAQIFSDFEKINWLQGAPTVIDEDDRIFTDPHHYEVDKFYFYNREHSRSHKFIQQESTFWRRDLWVKAGGHVSIDYKFAGDFELWMRFFRHAKLYHVNAVLGSFRQSPSGQASVDHYQEYLNETFTILDQMPLSPKEKKILFIYNLLNKINAYCQRYYGFLMRKFKSHTIVRNALYFDPRVQKFREW